MESQKGSCIPDSATTLGNAAFANCNSLHCIIIPENITGIGDYAFSSCRNLAGVYFKGNPPALGAGVFNSVYYKAVIYYLPSATDWGATYGGLPTAVWLLSVADLDMDGEVRLWDFALLAAAWGATSGEPAYDPLCDISEPADGVIDAADLQVLAGNWMITPCQ